MKKSNVNSVGSMPSVRFCSLLVLGLGLLVLAAFLAPSAYAQGPWDTECPDCPPGFDETTDRSLRLDGSGNPHVAYGGRHLYYAYKDSGVWHTDLVDDEIPGDHGVGTYAALWLNGSSPHISYFANGDYRYAYKNGGSWVTETFDPGAGQFGGATSIGLDGSGYPHIVYYGDKTDQLKYAYKNGTGWHVENVEYVGGSDPWVSMVMDGSVPHISYSGQGTIKYGTRGAMSWTTENLTGNPSGTTTSLALDGSDKPHIAYYWSNNLYHAVKNGTWTIESADAGNQIGWYPSIALDDDDYAHISYYDGAPGNRDLKYVYWDGGNWLEETVDSGVSDVGTYTSLALDASDKPHILYTDDTNYDLKYARWTGSAWDKTVAADAGDVGRENDIALDGSDNPHISYYDSAGGNLKYAHGAGNTWTAQSVDVPDQVGRYTSIAVDGSDKPHISYYDVTGENLKYAHLNGSWAAEPVDEAGDVGMYSSVAVDGDDHPHISYYDASPNSNLKYAHWDGALWQVETVDSAGNVGEYTSLALDGSDKPHIAYYDASNGALKYTYWNNTEWVSDTVDTDGDCGEYPSLALDGAGHPHISYYCAPGFLDYWIRYAYHDGSDWHVEDIDWTSVNDKQSSLALDSGGYPHVTYYDGDEMWYAWKGVDGWGYKRVDRREQFGTNSSLALDGDDLAHVSYWGEPVGGLFYATGPNPVPPPPPPPDCNRYVDGSGNCNGETPCYPTIAAAVAAAKSYDGVCVFPGTYAESVDLSTMSTPGTIGLNALNSMSMPAVGTVIVDPDASGLQAAAATGPAFHAGITTPHPGSVYLDGFVVSSATSDGVFINATGHVVIQNVDASGSAEDGFDLEEIGGHVVISDCIANNTGDEGFDIWETTGNVSVSGSQADGNPWAGIAIWNTEGDVTVRDSQANNNTGEDDSDGIEVLEVEGSVLVDGCTANGNGDDGIDVDEVWRNIVISNSTTNNNIDESGVDVQVVGGKLTVSGCVSNGNGAGDGGDESSGFYLVGFGDVVVSDCVAIDNDNDGFDIEWDYNGSGTKPKNVTLTNLTAKDNGDDGIESDAEFATVIRGVTLLNNGSDAWEYYSDFGQPGDADVTFENSWLQGNDSEGLDFDGIHTSGDYAVGGNIICEHSPEDGLYLDSEMATDAEGNWWGASSGPTIASNPGGSGDTIGGETAQIDYTPWINTSSASATVDPVTGGQETKLRFKFSGGSNSVFLGPGPGDPNGTPPFSLTTDNGVLTSSAGTGATVREFVNRPDGVVEVSLTPFRGGTATVILTGPCGLQSSITVTVEGDAMRRVYLPVIRR